MTKLFAKMLGAFLLASILCSNAADVSLGPRDIIKVAVYDNPDLSLETNLNEAGVINFPLLGDVNLGGLTPAAASKKLAKLLKDGQFVRDPQVSITVLTSRSQMVSVLGEVKNPGLYPVDGKLTVTDLVAMAGGVTVEGGDTATLMRMTDGKATKDSIEIAGGSRPEGAGQNKVIVTGDKIFVDRYQRVYIYGEVTRPGAYRLEHDMTVFQVVSVGGGLTPRGTSRGIRIKRRDATGGTTETTAKLEDLVKADDILFVRESLF